MKKALLIVGVVGLVLLAAAGGFYFGMQYQTNKVNQAQANFVQARGQFPGGQPPNGAGDFRGGNAQANGQGFFQRNGTMGQVKSVEGNVLTLSTAADVTTVNLSDTTQIQKNTVVPLTVSDLVPGTRVVVTGEKDSAGNITASQIMILSDTLLNGPYPAPTGTEP